ncbi:unnamed protein product [Ambrosiozyma monospora]|uniref:Unnamed protein product n=1 Tax=Ambrosiozyma monospora TaxID=43982 RepID=A0A9W7DJ81_AMBMO|nr:unnamed protein product [Ambrosiozyma monospora]
MSSDDNQARRKRQKVDLAGLDMGYSSSSSSSDESEDETPKPTENQHEEDKRSFLVQPKTIAQDQISEEDKKQNTESSGSVEQHKSVSNISMGLQEESTNDEDKHTNDENNSESDAYEEEDDGLRLSDLESESEPGSDTNSDSESNNTSPSHQQPESPSSSSAHNQRTTTITKYPKFKNDDNAIKFLKMLDSIQEPSPISPFSTFELELDRFFEKPEFFEIGSEELKKELFDYWCFINGNGDGIGYEADEKAGKAVSEGQADGEEDEDEDEGMFGLEEEDEVLEFITYLHRKQIQEGKLPKYWFEMKRKHQDELQQLAIFQDNEQNRTLEYIYRRYLKFIKLISQPDQRHRELPNVEVGNLLISKYQKLISTKLKFYRNLKMDNETLTQLKQHLISAKNTDGNNNRSAINENNDVDVRMTTATITKSVLLQLLKLGVDLTDDFFELYFLQVHLQEQDQEQENTHENIQQHEKEQETRIQVHDDIFRQILIWVIDQIGQ